MPAIKLKETSARAPESISKEKAKDQTDAMLSELDDL